MQQELVDRNFLASTHVNTPDPRQDCPPIGQRLLVAWRFPKNVFDYGLTMFVTVRFWDNSEEEICYPLASSHGNKAFNFFDRKILTYRVQVIDSLGYLIDCWEHHFWTKLIDVDRSNSSVSSHPKQGSVMDTP